MWRMVMVYGSSMLAIPTNPIETGFYNTARWAYGVDYSESYAYVADDLDGLRIIDVSDPANPTESGYYDTIGEARMSSSMEIMPTWRIIGMVFESSM